VTRALDKCGDEELACRAAVGSDTAAVGALYDRHAQGIVRYCQAVLRDAEEAADAAQEVWARALRSMRGKESGGSEAFRPWLYTIARNECMDRFRRRSRESATELSETQLRPAPAVDRVYEAREEMDFAMRDIAGLPEPSRSAIALRELAGFDQREVADSLGLPAERAGRLVAEARRTLTDRRAGRAMDCDEVRLAVTDLRVRSLRLRGHIESCRPCRAFERHVRGRRLSSLCVAPIMALRGFVRWLAPLTGTAHVEGAVAALGSSAVAAAAVLTLALPAPGQAGAGHRGDRSAATATATASAAAAAAVKRPAPAASPSASDLVAGARTGVRPRAEQRAGRVRLAEERRETPARQDDRPRRVAGGAKPARGRGGADAPYPTSKPGAAPQRSPAQAPSPADTVAGAGQAVSDTAASVTEGARPVVETVRNTARAVPGASPSPLLAAGAP